MDISTHSCRRSRSTPYAPPSSSAMDLPRNRLSGIDTGFQSFLFVLSNGEKLPYLATPCPSPSEYSSAPAVCLYDSTYYSSIIPAIPLDFLDDKIFEISSVFLGHLDPNNTWLDLVSYARWKDWIYVISGAEPGSSGSSFSMSSQLRRFPVEQLKEFVCARIEYELMSPMHSAKGETFLAIEHNNFIYVFPSMFNSEPLHHFEAYNCVQNTWEVLESSPFHDFSGAYRTSNGGFSYLIIDDRICISSIRGAFAYDIGAKRWEPCYLFEDFSYPPSLKQKQNLCFDDVALGWAKHERALYKEGNVCKVDDRYVDVGGSPFKFLGQGLLYEEDILICKSRNGRFVLAYRIDSGRVVEMQYLIFFALGLQSKDWFSFTGLEMDIVQSDPMVYLGCGCFSLTCRRIINEVSKLVALIFRISRLAMKDASKDKFLACDIISLDAIEDVEQDYQLTPFFYS